MTFGWWPCRSSRPQKQCKQRWTWARPGMPGNSKQECEVSSTGSPLRAELGLQVDFGENYVQELLEKASALPSNVRPKFYLRCDMIRLSLFCSVRPQVAFHWTSAVQQGSVRLFAPVLP